MAPLEFIAPVRVFIREGKQHRRDGRYKGGFKIGAPTFTVIIEVPMIPNSEHAMTFGYPTRAEAEEAMTRILRGKFI